MKYLNPFSLPYDSTSFFIENADIIQTSRISWDSLVKNKRGRIILEKLKYDSDLNWHYITESLVLGFKYNYFDLYSKERIREDYFDVDLAISFIDFVDWNSISYHGEGIVKSGTYINMFKEKINFRLLANHKMKESYLDEFRYQIHWEAYKLWHYDKISFKTRIKFHQELKLSFPYKLFFKANKYIKFL